MVVFLFRPECPHTAESLPEIIRLHNLQEKIGFKVLPISIGEGSWEAIQKFRRLNPGSVPSVFSIYRLKGAARCVFKDLRMTPTTYILDREGGVPWRIYGATPGALTRKVNHILSEPRTSFPKK